MNQSSLKKLSFTRLISTAATYLQNNLRFKTSTVKSYQLVWKVVEQYMKDKKLTKFSRSVADKLFAIHLPHKRITKLPRKEKRFYYRVMDLVQLLETGKIKPTHSLGKSIGPFSGEVGQAILKYLNYREENDYFSNGTRYYYEREFDRFYRFLESSKIHTLKKISPKTVLRYLENCSVSLHIPIRVLKEFFRYLHLDGIITTPIYEALPKVKFVSRPKLVSHYSNEEIEKLLLAIDRSSITGKRDYAMAIIVARLGFRASDVVFLRLDEIHWERNSIIRNQHKTNVPIITHLFPDVGNAIIEYLKYRPKSEEPYVFLTTKPPFGAFTTGSSISYIFKAAFSRAGINTHRKKTGPHALRHSLGRKIQKSQNGNLHAVAEALGHINTQSALVYTSVDFEAMRQCTLKVPAIADAFYKQKGFWYDDK